MTQRTFGRVAVLMPHYATEPTAHCARMNDALLHFPAVCPELKLEIISVSALPHKPGLLKINAFLQQAYRAIRGADLVHVAGFLPGFLLLRLMSMGKPLVIGPNITGASFPKSFLGKQALNALEEERPWHWIRWYLMGYGLKEIVNVRAMAGCSAVLVLSEYAADIVASRGCERARLRVLPFAAPAATSSDSSCVISRNVRKTPHPRIAYAGRLDRRKGFDSFLEMVRQNDSSGTFHVFGDGPLMGEARQFADQDSRLFLHGKVSRSELIQLFQFMDIYVQPSTYEAIATTVFEALRAGVPVLSADIPAHREAASMLPGITLYPSGDQAEASRCILTLVRELDCAKAEARRAGTTLDPKETAVWLAQLYKNTIKKQVV